VGVSKQLFIFGSNSTPMPVEDRSNYKKIQVWLPLHLWDKLVSLGYSSPTNTVLTALELLCTKSQETPKDSQHTPKESQDTPIVDILNSRLEEKDSRIKELQDHQQNRIEDLKNHIFSLDNQMRTKDDQIEKLNENMHKQAVHIQTLIQEISQLNVKLIPENTENKKPWYKFW
jgi:hypothetical protein